MDASLLAMEMVFARRMAEYIIPIRVYRNTDTLETYYE